jgi:hypothetical protein
VRKTGVMDKGHQELKVAASNRQGTNIYIPWGARRYYPCGGRRSWDPVRLWCMSGFTEKNGVRRAGTLIRVYERDR